MGRGDGGTGVCDSAGSEGARGPHGVGLRWLRCELGRRNAFG